MIKQRPIYLSATTGPHPANGARPSGRDESREESAAGEPDHQDSDGADAGRDSLENLPENLIPALGLTLTSSSTPSAPASPGVDSGLMGMPEGLEMGPS